MKTIKIVIMLLMAFSVAATAQVKKAKKAKSEVVFSVNMHCANCKARIEKNISWEKGVKDLDVNLEKKTVKITYDPAKTNEKELQKAITKLDYTCVKVEEKKKK